MKETDPISFSLGDDPEYFDEIERNPGNAVIAFGILAAVVVVVVIVGMVLF